VFDKSTRSDGSFARSDFTYDHRRDHYVCPGGKKLKQYHRSYATPRPGVDKDGFMRYRASKSDCEGCALKPRCCPGQPARKIPRSIHEGARDMARDLSLHPATQCAFSIYENKGVFALLLGSGISRAARIPTGWEITLDLIRRVALARGAEEQPDWAAWYRAESGEEPNYSNLLEELGDLSMWRATC